MLVVGPDVFEQSIVSLVPGKTYRFKILATSLVGDSALSSQVTIKAAQKPDQPMVPELVYQSSTAITMDWTAPNDNFDPILDYYVYWDKGLAGDFELLTDTTGNQVEFTKDNTHIPELVPGEYYQFKVSAINSIGESVISDPVSIIASTVPDAPTAPENVVSEKLFIEIRWQIPYNGGDEIDDYQIDYKHEDEVYNWETIFSTGNLNQYTITDLLTGEIYDFRVRAHNDVGYGDNSPVTSLMAAIIPSKPNAPSKFSADQSQISIHWTAPADDGGTPITGYRVLWNMGGEQEVYVDAFSTDGDTYAYTKGGL
jgi:titin